MMRETQSQAGGNKGHESVVAFTDWKVTGGLGDWHTWAKNIQSSLSATGEKEGGKKKKKKKKDRWRSAGQENHKWAIDLTASRQKGKKGEN